MAAGHWFVTDSRWSFVLGSHWLVPGKGSHLVVVVKDIQLVVAVVEDILPVAVVQGSWREAVEEDSQKIAEDRPTAADFEDSLVQRLASKVEVLVLVSHCRLGLDRAAELSLHI